jgi:iron complex outermembrane receptor protein
MKLFKNRILIRSFLLACMAFIFIQSHAANSITGRIIDNKKQPIGFATVTLLNSKTNKYVKGETSNEKGEFVIDKVSPGNYILSVTMVGYLKNESEKVVIDSKNTVVEKNIILKENAVQLGTVVVAAKKKFIEQTVDKMIVNPEASVTSAGDNVYEILKKVPGVTIDNNENISLKGKQGVMILIDEKPTYVSVDQLATLLKSMQGKNVDRIEIMENPPARFDAEGNAGIINIKTKHNKAPGFNGSINAGTNVASKTRENGGLDLNLNLGKLNVYGNYSYYSWAGWNALDATRRFTSTELAGSYQLINSLDNYHGHANNYKIGADYFIQKNQVISFMIHGNNGSNMDENNSKTSFADINKTIDTSLTTISSNPNKWDNKTYNVNYKWDIDSTGRSLSVDADYAHFYFRSTSDQNSDFFDKNGNSINKTATIHSEQGSDIDVITAKIDYVHPINKIYNFETGVKTSFVTNDSRNDMVGYTNQHDKFIYTENIQAGYVNGRAQYNKTSLQLGLRLENTNSTGNSVSTSQVNKASYLKLFPSFFVQQTLNKNNTINFSYSYRIGRPNYNMLNPFVWTLDPYTQNTGNPLLNPQFTHAAKISHTYKSLFITSIGYNYTNDPYTMVLYQNDITKVVTQTMTNLSNSFDFNASETFQLPVAKWWNMNGTVTGLYNEVNSNVGEAASFKRWCFNGNITNNFTLPYSINMELSGYYTSYQLMGNVTLNPRYNIDFGAQRKFMKDKIMLKVSVNDIFNTNRSGGYSKYNNVDINFKNTYDSRRMNVSLSYRFGKDDFKTRANRSTASSEEESRSSK